MSFLPDRETAAGQKGFAFVTLFGSGGQVRREREDEAERYYRTPYRTRLHNIPAPYSRR